MDLRPSTEDFDTLFQQVPIVAEQLKAIVLTRLLRESQTRECHCNAVESPLDEVLDRGSVS